MRGWRGSRTTGRDASSRRSMVDRTATQAPAAGPPRTIAAPTNGRWNVKWNWWSRLVTERIDPSRPNMVHSRTPPVVPASAVPSRWTSAIPGRKGTTAVTRTSRPKPSTISPAVQPWSSDCRDRATAASPGRPGSPEPDDRARSRRASHRRRRRASEDGSPGAPGNGAARVMSSERTSIRGQLPVYDRSADGGPVRRVRAVPLAPRRPGSRMSAGFVRRLGSGLRQCRFAGLGAHPASPGCRPSLTRCDGPPTLLSGSSPDCIHPPWTPTRLKVLSSTGDHSP